MISRKRKGKHPPDKTFKKTKKKESSSFLHHGLNKNIWMHIITFLQTREILATLTTLNKFFNSCITESPRMLQAVQIALNLQQIAKTQKTIIFPEQALEYLKAAENIESLKLLIRNEGIIPNLTNLNPLVKVLPSMPWIENLQVLDLKILNFNYLVIKSFLNCLVSLKDLTLTLGCEFPIFICDLIAMFIDHDDRKSSENACCYRTLQKFKVVYLKLSIGNDHDIKLFEVLDRNIELNSFYLDFKSKVPILNSCVPVLKINKNLRYLRLPPAFTFTTETSKNFLEYLKTNETLETLEISETLISSFDCFLETASTNKYLKSLSLLPFIPDAGFSINFSQIIKIVECLESSNLQEFFLSTESFEVNASDLNQEPDENAYLSQNLASQTYSKIFKSFKNNKKLQKLLIKIENLSQVFISAFKKITECLPEDNQGSFVLLFDKKNYESFNN